MFPSRNRSVPRPPPRSGPVIAVGQRVFVNCPGDRSGTVVLEDESGKVPSTVHLTDGVVVEVVAWRPRGTGDARYRVRRATDGADGWLGGDSLRRTADPAPLTTASESAPTPAAPETDGNGNRPFGQRSHVERSVAFPSPPTSVPQSTNSDSVGRRFGQR